VSGGCDQPKPGLALATPAPLLIEQILDYNGGRGLLMAAVFIEKKLLPLPHAHHAPMPVRSCAKARAVRRI
jgi:hypothetical protein